MEDKKKEFLANLKSAAGIISTACEKTGVSRTTYYNWKNTDEDFACASTDIMEMQGDFVESKLLENINNGDTTAIIFYCKTKLKHRGYTERPMPRKQPDTTETPTIVEATTDMKKRIINKKKYIVKLLKEQGKYTAELSMQCEIVAQLWAKTDQLKDEIFSEGYNSVKIELSREGNQRISVNPKEGLYQKYLKQTQEALRALGMNTESKERKTEQDGFGDFLKQFAEDDD